MSSNVTRFTKQYLNFSRTDVAQSFPRHVFLREPNKGGSFIHNNFVRRNHVNP